MKRKFKIALDFIMLLMTLTLFSKQFISMQYHEIAGLILIALIAVHIAVNIRTVKAMCKKFIRVPAAIKTGLVVDILLLICFAVLGISGILISHTVLTNISSDNIIFKMLHMFSGGLSVILLGVHIGLHICRRPMPVITAVIISAMVFCGGIYGAANSNVGRWLSMPFAVTSQQGGPRAGSQHGFGNGQGNMKGEIHENGVMYREHNQNGQQGKPEGRNRQALTPLQKLQNIIMFLGMILSCAMITYWISIPKKEKIAVKYAKIEG